MNLAVQLVQVGSAEALKSPIIIIIIILTLGRYVPEGV